MELMQLNYFRTVARTGKIAAAAQELFLSAPALSTSISRLEAELGVPLFDRSGNRIALNEQGELFLRYADQVFDTLDRAKSELRHSLLHRQQHIWLVTAGSNLWTDLIPAFSQEHPQFTLTCTSLDHATMDSLFAQYTFLLAETEDIPETMAQTLDSLPLFEDQPAVLVHPDHPLAQEKRVPLSRLRGETLYLPARGMPRRERLIRLLQAHGIDPDAINSCTYLIYRSIVQQNLGVAFTTMRSNHVNLGDLRIIPLENDLAPWIMRLYWQKEHVMTEAEQAFRSFVEQYYQGA